MGYRTGHHYNFNFSLIEQWKDRGLPFLTLGHSHYDETVGRELRIQPVFQATQYDGPAAAAAVNISPKPALQLLARALFIDLVKHSSLIGQPGDVVVFQIVNAGMLLAAAAWLRDFHHTWDGPVVLYFMGVDYSESDEDGWNGMADLYRAGFRILSGIPAVRLRLIAEHQEIAHRLENLCGRSFPIAEAPHFKPGSQILRLLEMATAKEGSGTPVRIGYLGHARSERGAHLVPRIVQDTRRIAGDRAAFLVHMDLASWHKQQVCPDLRERLMDLAPGHIQRLCFGDLTMEAYYDFLGDIDLLLLPYGGRASQAGSGVYFEALACGKPMVVPRNSFMHRHQERLGGGFVTFDTMDESSIAAAVVVAIDAFPELQARAMKVGPAWQREHDMPDFASSLLG